jgi:hypothetical protein
MNKHFKLTSIKIQLMSHAKLWKTFYLAVLLIYTTHCWQFFHMLYYKELFAQKPHLFLSYFFTVPPFYYNPPFFAIIYHVAPWGPRF